MDFGLVMAWVVVGLVAGWLAGLVMKGGGYGLKGDLLIGLIGSLVGNGLFWALGISAEAGMLAGVVVAFLGGILLILAQRTWYARA